MSAVISQQQTKPLAAVARKLRRGAWALADQMLLSGSNFVTMVLVARGLSRGEFGEFTLIYSGLLFANLAQATLITQPHNVLASTRGGADYRRYTTSAGAGQLLFCIVAALLTLMAAGLGWSLGWSVAGLLAALAPCIIAWQSQEFTRRVLYTEGRTAAAFFNDLLSYGGQALLIGLLWHAEQLTAQRALYILAATSATAALLGLWQIRHSLARDWKWSSLWENWNFGKWLLGAELLQWLSSIQWYLFIAAAMFGTSATAMLKAAAVIFGPTRVLISFLDTILPIRFSKALAHGGPEAMNRQYRWAFLLVTPMLAGYCGLVALFAGPLLRLAYGKQYADDAPMLMLYAMCAFPAYVSHITYAALAARRQTRHIFMAYVYTALFTVGIGWALLHWMGVNGTFVGLTATALMVNCHFWLTYRRHRHENNPSAELADESTKSTPQGDMMEHTTNGSAPADPGEHPTAPTAAVAVLRFFELLERHGVPYCILDSYEGIGQQAPSGDIDCVIPANYLPRRLAALIAANRDFIGADLVQWHDSNYIVMASQDQSGKPWFVRIDVHADYNREDRTFYFGEEVLSSRQQHNSLWVPSADLEFGCYLVKKVAKNALDPDQARRLSDLYRSNPQGCRRHVDRFWNGSGKLITEAADTGDWSQVISNLPRLRTEMLMRRRSRFSTRLGELGRKIRRWIRPHSGLHVVLLGPDGVGKSTVQEAVEQDLAPAFGGRISTRTFAPGLLGMRHIKPGQPHGLPPRSLPAAYAKAVYWAIYYSVGYYFTVWPDLARSRMALNHRYFVDSIADPKRYRYKGPIWLLKLVWKVAVKPDVIILLDAPPEVVQARKKEVPFEETARQRGAYRSLVEPMRNGHVVDATQPAAKVVSDVEKIILDHLSCRTARRFGLKGAT
ncbi:MAG: oligosaccharide flippase family protein [Phycisphaerales bacterium]|jgi:O-antigen/teichoic acid export membrane protein/thymidylate kinase|nr:oligosaccharide flippase family protein [Phycisphaerales bacterium]